MKRKIKKQCRGETLQHRRCQNEATQNGYCSRHQDQVGRSYSESPNEIFESWQEKFLPRRGKVGKVVAIFLTMALVIGIFSGWVEDVFGLAGRVIGTIQPEPIEKMSDDFNIAIASPLIARNIDKESRTKSLETVNRIYERINIKVEEYRDSSLLIETWSPDKTGIITGDSPGEQQENADLLMKRISAHVLIYSNVVMSEHGPVLELKMYVSAERFMLIPELIGDHLLDEGISLVDDTLENEERLTSRAESISLLALGLFEFWQSQNASAQLQQGLYTKAIDSFSRSLGISSWHDDAGKSSVYLMRGNTYSYLEQYDLAIDDFSEALVLNPDYGRAYIGLGETLCQLALEIAIESNNRVEAEAIFLEAEKAFDMAEATTNQPKSADIPLKVAFGKGRVSIVRYYLLDTFGFGETEAAHLQLEKAKEYFRISIELGENNQRVAERVALSHGFSGSIAAKQQPPDFETAKNEFRIAIDTVQSHRAKAGFYDQLGDVYIEQGLINEAITALEGAIRNAPDEVSLAIYQEKLERLKKCQEELLLSTNEIAQPMFECRSRN